MTDEKTKVDDKTKQSESQPQDIKKDVAKPTSKRNYRNLAILAAIAAFGVALLLILFAVLKPFGVKVTFDANGGSEVAPIMVKRGEKIALPVSTKDGYAFEGWYLGDDKIIDLSDLKQAVTLKARWRELVTTGKKTFVVSFDSRGGSAVASITLNEGQALTLPPNPTLNGKTFEKWVDKNEMPILDGALLAPEDVTLYAVWTEAKVKTEAKTETKTSQSAPKVHTCPTGYAMAGAKCTKAVAPQYSCEGTNVFNYGDRCVTVTYYARKDLKKVCPTKTVHMGYGHTQMVQGELVNMGMDYCFYGHVPSVTDQSTCTSQGRKWATPVRKCFVERDQNYTSSCDAGYVIINRPQDYGPQITLNSGCFPLSNKTAKCSAPYTLTGTQCIHTVEPILQ